MNKITRILVLQVIAITASYAIYLARQPNDPVTAEEILKDGGDYVVTPDGRFIEYFTCGDTDDNNATNNWVYMQHGYGSNGKFIHHLPNICREAKMNNLRLFSPSMPGFGMSTNHPIGTTRKLQDWPNDVKLILDKLGIQKFYASGTSTGCVHAFVVAHAFPDKILGIGVNTPTAPLAVESSVSQIAPITKYLRILLEYDYIRDVLGWLMSKLSVEQRIKAAPDVAAALDKMLEIREPWMVESHAGWIADQSRGVVKGHRGWSDTMATINEDLPFPANELNFVHEKGMKFVMTSASDDTTNPPQMQAYWANAIKGVEIISRPEGWGHAHGSVPGCFDEIYKRMMVDPVQ